MIIVLLARILLTFLSANDGRTTEFSPVRLPHTETRILQSKNVAVTYELSIGLPRKFDPKKSYDFLILLDADYSFPIARSTTLHLIERNEMDDVLLIGVGYQVSDYRRNRTRDYTPTFSLKGGYGVETQRVSGGGRKFLGFIERELLPFLKKEYGEPKTLTLVGHSYGGLFASWVMFRRPDLFDNYISISPSLWYDDRLMFRIENAYHEQNRQLKAKVFLAVGSGEAPGMRTDLQRFAEQVEKHEYGSFQMESTILENENHNTIFPYGFSRGLRYVFSLR